MLCKPASFGLLITFAALATGANTPTPAGLAEAGHWRRAQALVEPRLRANPNDAEAAYLMSRVRLMTGDLDEALKLAEKAASLDPKNASYRYQVAAVAGTMAQRASMFRQHGLARRFKREAEAALALDPKYVEARWGLMMFYLQAPGIIGGDKKKAQEFADEIARLDPVRGWMAKAEFVEREKRTAEIGAYYQKAVEANPKSYQAQMTLASFYASDAQKKYDLAERHAREALKIDPDRAGAYSQLAALYAYQSRLADLDAILAQSEKAIPDNRNPYYQAGRVFITQGKELARAESYFRKYLAQEPELNAPNHAGAHWRLGQTLEKLGRKQEAIRELETAVRMNPNLEEAKKDLKRLKG